MGLAHTRGGHGLVAFRAGHPCRHMPFAPISGRAPHVEPRILQGPAQLSGARPGGDGCPRRRQCGQVAQQGQGPHPRIVLGRKAIEKKGVHARAQPGRENLRIAKTQRQGDRAVLEFQAMQARQQGRPLRDEAPRQLGQRFGRITRQQRGQVLAGERMTFH
ncbi:hypothetical protein D3C85_1178630 [compost metagenome]